MKDHGWKAAPRIEEQPFPKTTLGEVDRLWLDVSALLDRNMAKVLETLRSGLNSREHGEFVQFLASRVTAGS